MRSHTYSSQGSARGTQTGRETADRGRTQIKPARVYEEAHSDDDDHERKERA